MTFFFIKRFIDIIGSIALLIFFSPIIAITAVLIKLTSPGPVFADIPMRVGLKGKLFLPYKFRSMIVNAHKLLLTDPKLKKLQDTYKKEDYKIHSDPRITPVGKIIRKYSIDEVPQLINVLRGEMSIVGPRPLYQEELKEKLKQYPDKKKLFDQILSVKPGITGYWQVSGRSSIDFDKRIEMDASYARKRSLVFDVVILLKTPWAMLSGKNTV